MGFIDSADDTFSTQSGLKNLRSLVVETSLIVWVLFGLWNERVQVTEWWKLPMVRCSFLVWFASSSQSLGQQSVYAIVYV